MFVKKRNGALQRFSKQKIIKGCRRAGAKAKDAKRVANIVAKKVYDRISTKKIGTMVVANLKKFDKKAALSFERFFKKKWK